MKWVRNREAEVEGTVRGRDGGRKWEGVKKYRKCKLVKTKRGTRGGKEMQNCE